MAAAALTPERRAVAAALGFLACATLAGMQLSGDGVRYRTFGLTEGIFALALGYMLTMRRVWPEPRRALEWLPVAYGTVATAQVLELLFPPPGVIEWVVVAGVAVQTWGMLAGGSRHRLAMRLATLAILLALLRFSVIPVLSGSPQVETGLLGIENPMTSARRSLFANEPVSRGGELLAFVAVCLWALATRLIWPPPAAPAQPLRDRDLRALPESQPPRLRPPAEPPPS